MWRRRMRSRLTEGTENHEQAFAERSGDLALVQPAHLHKVALGEVDPDLLPCLAQGSVYCAVV